MNRPFVIYALPRSRTAWLAKFLTYGGWTCGHDVITKIHTLDGVADYLRQPLTGTAETGLVTGWKGMLRRINHKRIAIRRSPIGVKESLHRLGIDWEDVEIDARAAKLDELSAYPGTKVYTYSELAQEWACKEIFEWCLGIPFDRDWWLTFKDANIQVDLEQRLAELTANQAGVQKIIAEMAAC